MTRFLLVRHGTTDAVGVRLAGRLPGFGLNAKGCDEARRLALRVARLRPQVVHASPLQRTVETAHVVADALGATVQHVTSLIELDFGEWNGRTFEELDRDPAWQAFNRDRVTAAAPRGESMLAMQVRALGWIIRTAAEHVGPVVAVTHADLIRALLAAACGISLDHVLRIDILPASITELVVDRTSIRVARVNDAAHLDESLSD